MLRCCLAKVARRVKPVRIFHLEIENGRLDSKYIIESELKGRERRTGSSNCFLDEYSQGEDLRVQYGNRLIRPYGFDEECSSIYRSVMCAGGY